ncbi:hypothetical protein BO83DRAFT_458683 [Aspergillus eucalypticola CBS 122712]|uniref:Uncharacterized protein n=1 Tax=Aspergillus eucalypticola (strain CBS 122712 / IBT 29274) TaxID=1448314 RepID=A0A317ULZ8_ASPEC|nr:uncharacterized protein BO83DRAFT_458683 [Aspergillus eucalypticola CBS 122712]PWY62419.1 hypothetical protein BO83DRAFT_458683 [Aspergillus eucalypticola CBS 122712]
MNMTECVSTTILSFGGSFLKEKSPYERCKFVHEIYKDIIILTGCDKKPSTKLPRAVILDCVTSSLYTATYGAGGNRLAFIIANKREE